MGLIKMAKRNVSLADDLKSENENPDHRAEILRINRIQGQLDGIKKMIESQRYCPEILTQTKAITSAIRALEAQILEKHLRHCVQNALAQNSDESAVKIEELVTLFLKRLDR